MRRLAASLLFVTLSLLPAASASAQFEQSDRQYAEERNAERQDRNLMKIYVGSAVLAVSGVVWAVAKLRERAKAR